MISRRQRIVNFFARWCQKPMLALVRPPRLARALFYFNAVLLHRTPAGLSTHPLPVQRTDGSPLMTAVQLPGPQAERGTLLYIHGGAFILGNLRGYRHLIARLARAAGQRGVYVDYRLAPENPYPAAVDDAETAFRALLADPQAHPITLVGDSAGGNIALALLLRLKDRNLPLPAACALMSPITDLRLTNRSLLTNLHRDPLVPASWGMRGVTAYLGGADPGLPEISPIHGDFTGAPPIFLTVDTAEVLRDDSRLLAEHLRAQGVDVTFVEEKGRIHVWHLHVGFSPEADADVALIGRFLRDRIDSTFASQS